MKLTNNTDAAQTVTVEFQLSTFGIGLAFNRIPTTDGPNPRTVVIPPHNSIEVCATFVPSTPGHHCMNVVLTSPNGYSTHSAMNLDIAERLTPGEPTETPIPVGNPTGAVADMDLVVDNTCPGWTATVAPATLAAVGPNSSDIRTAILTVTPPAGGLLGSNCHIDVLAYINGVLIGGVRKIDRPPVAPPIDEPHYAEREITVTPDPPVVGRPAQVCVTLTNPTDQDQHVDVTFAYADFGAGINFTDIQAVHGAVIPAHGTTTLCIPWTPQSGGTLHRCIRVKVSQEGYHDIYSQRNLDLRRFLLVRRPDQPLLELPPFMIHNPLPDPAPIQLDVRTLGFFDVFVELFDAQTGRPVQPGAPLSFDGGESRSFFLRVREAADATSAATGEAPGVIGEHGLIDVVPYLNGQPMTVDGVETGVQFEVDPPALQLLPLILH